MYITASLIPSSNIICAIQAQTVRKHVVSAHTSLTCTYLPCNYGMKIISHICQDMCFQWTETTCLYLCQTLTVSDILLHNFFIISKLGPGRQEMCFSMMYNNLGILKVSNSMCCSVVHFQNLWINKCEYTNEYLSHGEWTQKLVVLP